MTVAGFGAAQQAAYIAVVKLQAGGAQRFQRVERPVATTCTYAQPCTPALLPLCRQ